LFMRTPASKRPGVGATISRMASIPHGTTINAQCLDPGFVWTNGAPQIDGQGVDITPFFIDQPQNTLGAFHNLTATTGTRNRLPNVLGPFAKVNAIQNFKHPLQTLADLNKVKNIIKFRTFKVTTESTDALPGGGTANIAFLQGKTAPTDKNPDANANAVTVTCQYWISVVQVEVEIQPTMQNIVEVTPPAPANTPLGVTIVHPTFIIRLRRPLAHPVKFNVNYTQIQYAQNVTLNFGVLSWPHISVATLIPGGADFSGKIEINPAELPAELR